jgi:hypothetical protein
VISSRRGDQIPDPDAEATPGIAPSDPLATVLSSMTSSRVLRRASKFAAAEDDDDARNPRRTRGGGPPSCETLRWCGVARWGGGGRAEARRGKGRGGGLGRNGGGGKATTAVRVFNRSG